jgi:hypothetical protein
MAIDAELGDLDNFTILSRIVHLPLSWNDPAIHQTIERNMAIVRDDAPWCSDNIEFIRRAHGLDSADDMYRTVFDAHYSSTDLDAAQCRGHRRRLYVHLWDGRARRLPAVRLHDPGL